MADNLKTMSTPIEVATAYSQKLNVAFQELSDRVLEMPLGLQVALGSAVALGTTFLSYPSLIAPAGRALATLGPQLVGLALLADAFVASIQAGMKYQETFEKTNDRSFSALVGLGEGSKRFITNITDVIDKTFGTETTKTVSGWIDNLSDKFGKGAQMIWFAFKGTFDDVGRAIDLMAARFGIVTNSAQKLKDLAQSAEDLVTGSTAAASARQSSAMSASVNQLKATRYGTARQDLLSKGMTADVADRLLETEFLDLIKKLGLSTADVFAAGTTLQQLQQQSSSSDAGVRARAAMLAAQNTPEPAQAPAYYNAPTPPSASDNSREMREQLAMMQAMIETLRTIGGASVAPIVLTLRANQEVIGSLISTGRDKEASATGR